MGKRKMPKFESTGLTMAIPPGRFPEGDERIGGMRILRQGQPPRSGEFGIFPPTANGDFLVWSSDGLMPGGGKRIGINSIPLTKQLGDYFGVSDGKGVLVSNVRENSPAAKVGLKAGDVIIEADGKPVSDQMGLVKALNAEGKKSVSLTIIRDKKRLTITVEPEGDDTNQKILEKVITTNN
jgi:membrane-associated protease RseP (regulator of RpoE activity)